MDKNIVFSVLISVYKNDNAAYFKAALESITIHQTLKPSEVVLVCDGPLHSDTNQVILEVSQAYPSLYKIVRFEKNQGLGIALQKGVQACSNEIIMRMDSDDIAMPDRFEKQITYLVNHPECDIVGGQITEFIGNPENVIGKRVVPCENSNIYKYMRMRCALNHPTVMFRKQSVLDAGNYQDWFWNEDYYLWIRMMERGCVFANLPDILVNMRSGLDQYGRRGGKKYFNSEIAIKKLMLKKGMITYKEFFINYIQRFILQLILPNSIRGLLFRTFARKK